MNSAEGCSSVLFRHDDQSDLAPKTVLCPTDPKPDDKPARREALGALTDDFSAHLTGYRKELGPNAYAVFNTLTDIAARPPDLPCFQQTRDTIERRSGRWPKELAKESLSPTCNLERCLVAIGA